MKNNIPFLCAILLTSCSSYPTTTPPANAHNVTPNKWSNSIATYYDTDGDGKADEWRRGDKYYYDENKDGKVDRMIELDALDGPPPMVDSDTDGYFDSWQSGDELTPIDARIPVPIFPH